MPELPIKDVDPTLDYFTYGFFWTEWFNIDDPSSNSTDAELLHDVLRDHDVCKGALPMGVNCRTVNGIHWSKTGQQFAVPCSLDGIVCESADNLPDGCLDYKVQFYCSQATSDYTLPPRLMKQHMRIASSQAPAVESRMSVLQSSLFDLTLPPVEEIKLRAGAGEGAMQGRGKCGGAGHDQVHAHVYTHVYTHVSA